MYSQGVLDRSLAGFTLTAVVLGWSVGATLGARIIRRFGLRAILLCGTGLLPVGGIVFVHRPDSSPLPGGLRSLVTGLGMGLLSTAAIMVVQSSGGTVEPVQWWTLRDPGRGRPAHRQRSATRVRPHREAKWGFMRQGVTPDLITLNKPMGNGYPVAGIVARPELPAEFGARTRYFDTFGGNPVACATARALPEVIEDEALMANALAVGQLLQDGLRTLAGRYEAIGDIRGAGLFVGVELVRDRATRMPDRAFEAKVVNALRQRRILLGA